MSGHGHGCDPAVGWRVIVRLVQRIIIHRRGAKVLVVVLEELTVLSWQLPRRLTVMKMRVVLLLLLLLLLFLLMIMS